MQETNFESSAQPGEEQQQLNTSRFGNVHPLVSQAVEYLSKPRYAISTIQIFATVMLLRPRQPPVAVKL
jgi:hypothetical protein